MNTDQTTLDRNTQKFKNEPKTKTLRVVINIDYNRNLC